MSSPVGDFPFEAKRLSIKNGRMVLDGAMGAWPARVEMEPKDIISLARLLPWPAFAVAGITLASLVGRRRRSTSA
ncbi:MAG TPA: hypothetical protein VGR77_05175 [Candidatus Dormibacteraeota bacterium]|nr:hypothetical protein [Candidatus Dormibacteraeota bacterium]